MTMHTVITTQNSRISKCIQSRNAVLLVVLVQVHPFITDRRAGGYKIVMHM